MATQGAYQPYVNQGAWQIDDAQPVPQVITLTATFTASKSLAAAFSELANIIASFEVKTSLQGST